MSDILRFLYILLSLGLSSGAIGHYYANQYPYRNIGYATSGGSSETAGGSGDASAYLKNNAHDEGKNTHSMLDTQKFVNKENLSNGRDLEQKKVGSSVDDMRRSTGQDFETDKSHNRKFIKSGFHNTYSKDEKGSNSSFYEDSDDRGEKLVYDKRHGVAGDSYDSNFREGVRDGQTRDRLDDRYRGYNNGEARDRQHFQEQNQGNRRGHRDGYNGGREEYYSDQRRSPYSDRGYYQTQPVQEFVRHREPVPRYRQGYTNGHLRNLVSDLPPPSLPLPPLPLNRNEDGYFAHRRITIYDDPREPIGPPRRNQFHTRGIYHSTPTLEFVRPSRTSYYYDVRDNFRW